MGASRRAADLPCEAGPRGAAPNPFKSGGIMNTGRATSWMTRAAGAFARLMGRRAFRVDSAHHERLMLRTLVDNLPDFIYAKDADCRFLLANASVARHMGTTPEQLL